MMTDRRAAHATLAAGLAALYGAMVWLVMSGIVARRPGPLGAAVTFDLTVSAAFATWLLGARRGRLHRRAPFVVLALGFAAARLILPPDAREGLVAMRLVWAAAELVVLALVVAQSGRIRARFRALRLAGAHPIDAVADALAPAVGALPARLLSTELTVLGYGIAGWWRATPPEDERTFSMHRRVHWGTIAGVFVFLILGETLGLHVVVQRWSHPAAWLLTASSVWAALWLIGDAHALRLHPLRVGADGLEVNVGVRWRVRVPWDAIASVERADSPSDAPGELAVTLARAADVRLTLSRPLQARGLFGRTRTFDRLLLTVDRPDELIAALRARR